MELLEQIKTDWKLEKDLTEDFDKVAIVCEEPEFYQDALGILGYWLGGPMALPSGEFSVSALSNQLFVADLDSTKTYRDDWFDALPFLREYLTTGTPIRKTNKAGEGTQGTRKYQALTGPFEIYFN